MTEVLTRIDNWLRTSRPQYYAALQPGIGDTTLDRFESQFSLRLPQSLRELYRWRNGQPNHVFESLQDNWMFSAIEDIADTKEMLDGIIGSDFEGPAWWRTGWVPFLANGGGDHLCIDTTAEMGRSAGQLVIFWLDSGNRPIKYKTVDVWLLTLADSKESGTLELS